MQIRFVKLVIPLTMSLTMFIGCGGNDQEGPTSVEIPTPTTVAEPVVNSGLDLKFGKAVEEFVESNWSTWSLGQQMGRCLIENINSMTPLAKQAVIKEGIEGAFKSVSGGDLESLSNAWDKCESQAKVAPISTSTQRPPSPVTVTSIVPSPSRVESDPIPTATPKSRPGTLIPTPTAMPNMGEEFNGRKCTTTSNPRPTFTHPIVDLNLISGTMPPGLAATGMLKPHGYFFLKHGDDESFGEKEWKGYPRSAPVYAPIKSWLRAVYPYRSGAYGKDAPEPPIEYMLVFEVSCEVYYKLDHLGPLSDLIEAAGPFEVGKNHELETPLEVLGGQLVSYWSGVNPGRNIDLGVYNTTIERKFVNSDRYTDGFHDAWLNEDCPFDYFPEALRKEYYSLFFDVDAGIHVGTRPCRTSAESDVPGTARGQWFLPGRYGSVFSLSKSMSGLVLLSFLEHAEKGGSFAIKVPPEGDTFIEPSKVTGGHCYQSHTAYNYRLHPMYVSLELKTPMELSAEYGKGTCAEREPIAILDLVR